MNESKILENDPFLEAIEKKMDEMYEKLSEEEKKHFKAERDEVKKKVENFKKL